MQVIEEPDGDRRGDLRASTRAGASCRRAKSARKCSTCSVHGPSARVVRVSGDPRDIHAPESRAMARDKAVARLHFGRIDASLAQCPAFTMLAAQLPGPSLRTRRCHACARAAGRHAPASRRRRGAAAASRRPRRRSIPNSSRRSRSPAAAPIPSRKCASAANCSYLKVTPRIGPPYYLVPGNERHPVPALRLARLRLEGADVAAVFLVISITYAPLREPASQAMLSDCCMSVYTPVSAADLDAWLTRYAVGTLRELHADRRRASRTPTTSSPPTAAATC